MAASLTSFTTRITYKKLNGNAPTSTPQKKKAAKGQKKNHEGAYTFVASDLDRVRRFLILGSESNHYVSGEKNTAENAKFIIKLLQSDPNMAGQIIDTIVEISQAGRAPKQSYGLFALALAASYGTERSKAYALAHLQDVARTASTLFEFVEYVTQFRGWGRALKRAVAEWYTDKDDIDRLAYQIIKYQSRHNYTHRDIFRLTHPIPFNSKAGQAAFEILGAYVLRGEKVKTSPKLIKGYLKAKDAPTHKLPELIRKYGLSWEMLPTEALNEPVVWGQLLESNRVPLGALIRQLPRLTRIGLLDMTHLPNVFISEDTNGLQTYAQRIVKRLTDEAELERARIHPLNLLVAQKVYASGGVYSKGGKTYVPNVKITNALGEAFSKAFKTVTPAGKKTLIGLDVSGSMGHSIISPEAPLTAREATAAIALVTLATEPEAHVIGFTGGSVKRVWGGFDAESYANTTPSDACTDLSSIVDPGRRLDDVVASVSNLPFGPTDCTLPILYALEKGLEIETFVIMTDNDTWAGKMHVHEALELYRKQTGIPARMVVLSTDANRSTILNPKDSGSLEIAGFDSAAPSLLADFSRGDI